MLLGWSVYISFIPLFRQDPESLDYYDLLTMSFHLLHAQRNRLLLRKYLCPILHDDARWSHGWSSIRKCHLLDQTV